MPPIDWSDWTDWLKEKYGTMSIREMVEYIGCERYTLHRAIKRLQEKGELPVLDLPTRKGRLSPEQVRQVHTLRADGMKRRDIAALLHVHITTVEYHLRRDIEVA